MSKEKSAKKSDYPSKGPYSCEELSNIVHNGEQMEFDRFMGFLILVTAFVAELEGRLETEPVQNWIEDEKKKVKSILYAANHEDCFRWFKPGAILIAQSCKEAIKELNARKPSAKALDFAKTEFQRIYDIVFNEGEGAGSENGGSVRKSKRNCDLYETENEAKEAYEELFYGTFQLKNCKDTIVALKPGSPEFSTWLMSPVKGEERKRLDAAKAEQDAELKTVADVVRKMTGVGPSRGYYFNSEIREFGRKIEEFHAKEIADIKKKGA